jgi:dihydrofolate reductase
VSRIIVIQFVTLDGIVHDPDGVDGSPHGGWAFRNGPEAIAGDKFALGEVLDTGALLLGRRTWEKFAGLWPTRDDDFSAKMNAIPKLVASRTLDDVSGWSNSTLLGGDLVAEAAAGKRERDLVVVGSASIAHALMHADLVDEYRMLVFPTLVGDGTRLFESPRASTAFSLTSARAAGPAALLVYSRAA